MKKAHVDGQLAPAPARLTSRWSWICGGWDQINAAAMAFQERRSIILSGSWFLYQNNQVGGSFLFYLYNMI